MVAVHLVWAGALLAAACGARQAPLRSASPAAPAVAAPAGALASGELDRILEESWRAARVNPAPVADDGAFLRRVTLDLVGRIPTLEEARSFLDDGRPDKRARAVDWLLASPEFAEHWADVYADLLFGGGEARRRLVKQLDPRRFLVRAFAEGWPYDQLVTALLTASGAPDETPALAFIAARLRGGGGIEAVAGATARLFLGLSIQCAQCHDHPYDARWRQRDFYGLVAAFARTRARRETTMDGPALLLVDLPQGETRHRAPGATTDEIVPPRFLGRALHTEPAETRRQALARALVASDLFPKAMVARTWTKLFGRGLVEPWDDLGAEREPGHPRALVRLADDFRARRFDVKVLLRTIVLSTAYARASAPAPGTRDGEGAAVRAFARAGVRPLSSEQLFASLVTATGAEELVRHRAGGDPDAVARRLRGAFREYEFAFGDDELAAVDVFDGSVPQALLLLNGELTNAPTRGAGNRRAPAASPPSVPPSSSTMPRPRPVAPRPAGLLARLLATEPEPSRRLDALFLAVYCRRPSAAERAALLPALTERAGDHGAWEDLHFALMTSTEAVTNH